MHRRGETEREKEGEVLSFRCRDARARASQAWEAGARSDPTLHRHCTGPLLRGLVEFVEFRATNENRKNAAVYG